MHKLVLGTGMGYDVPSEEQIKIIAKTGWEGVFTDWNGLPVLPYARLCKEYGLLYQSVHAPFTHAHHMWEESERAETELETQLQCLHDSTDAGVSLIIMHAIIGFDRHTPTQIGIDRYGKLFDEAERCGVTIAVENTEGEEYLTALLQAFQHKKNVGFCIDTGHELCYNGGQDLIGKYAEQLVCTHLNDNMRQTTDIVTWHDDSHLLPFDGLADWDGIAARLANVGYKGDLTFELTSKNKPERNTHDRYASLAFSAFVSLALSRAKRFKDLFLSKK